MTTHSAERLMHRFARETGLTGGAPPRRYLWTDAYALCTLVGLDDAFPGRKYGAWARALIGQVHDVLGSHHPDDGRTGPLAPSTTPLAGGLRIGKPLPERTTGEPEDPATEWNRDGQYFHYLTRWIHALCRASAHFSDRSLLARARELGAAATAFFTEDGMVWKMATDLSRPLVPRMGQHDPVDGLATFLELGRALDRAEMDGGDADAALDHLRPLVLEARLVTPDPLGTGGLLFDAFRLHRLDVEPSLRAALVEAAAVSLGYGLPLDDEAEARLAFRELGLAVGLHAAAAMGVLSDHWSHARRIETFWTEHAEWAEHGDINRVMLATSLAPAGFLGV
jgi:hypothetical protein